MSNQRHFILCLQYKMPTSKLQLICDICEFKCSKQSNYNMHLCTRKHLRRTSLSNIVPKIYKCAICAKTYKHSSSLSNHKRNCVAVDGEQTKSLGNGTDTNSTSSTEELKIEMKNMTKMMMELMKSNTELQQQLIDICKNTGITHNTTNSHNKTFNLQFFLNEQCKDAMNITDFVRSLNLQMEDLESLGELGYVEGMTNIIAKRLKDIDIYKRPIHCSDAKREIIHIKHENVWHKEEPGNPIFRSAVKMVVGGNFRLLAQWTKLHPESSQYNSRWNDVYNKLVKETSGGHGDYESNNNSIMRRLTKLVVIEK